MQQEEGPVTTLTQDQVRMTVFGMTCEACAVCVRQAMEAAGAREVHVDVGRKEATFTLLAGVAPAALREAVRAGWLSAGPDRPPAGGVGRAPQRSQHRPLGCVAEIDDVRRALHTHQTYHDMI